MTTPCLLNIISRFRAGPREFIIKAIATGLGLGYLPMIPGTFGTLLGIPICILLFLGGPFVYGIGTLLLTVAAVWVAGQADRVFGVHDSRKVVIDEICGFLFTMFLIPPTLATLAAGFILFRIFDILKPFPAGWIDRDLPGGWGVMLDDIVAGIYANLSLWGGMWIVEAVSRGGA